MPHNGVYFIPDDKVVGLIKLITRLLKETSRSAEYMKSEALSRVFDKWRRHE